MNLDDKIYLQFANSALVGLLTQRSAANTHNTGFPALAIEAFEIADNMMTTWEMQQAGKGKILNQISDSVKPKIKP